MDCRCSQFGCSICLDTASDAVVSRCGHLYCAPCLKQWLDTGPDNQFCPVCKAAISWREVIRVYGQGNGHSGSSEIPPPQTSQDNTAVQQGIGLRVSSSPRPPSLGEITARLRHFREVFRDFLRSSSRSSLASEDEDDDSGDVEAGDEGEEIATNEDEDGTDENEVSEEEQDDDEESGESGDTTQEDVTGSESDGVGRADDVGSDTIEVVRGLRLEDDLEYYGGADHVPYHAYDHSDRDDDFGGVYLRNNDEELEDDLERYGGAPYVPPQDYYQSDYDDDFNHVYDYFEDHDDYY